MWKISSSGTLLLSAFKEMHAVEIKSLADVDISITVRLFEIIILLGICSLQRN